MKTTIKLLLLLVTISIFTACCPFFYPYSEGRGEHRYYHRDYGHYGHDRGYYGNGDHRDRDDDRN